MKKLYIVANWKANKTVSETTQWFQKVISYKSQVISSENKEIIVCPPFTLLSMMHDFVKQNELPLHVGAQDVSKFGMGAYTGEVAAEQLKEFVEYSIVGHSERRKYFHETDDDVIKKIERLLSNAITPILCVSDMKQMDYYLMTGTVIVDNALKIIFVYEPPSAISGGGAFRPEDPDTANKNAAEISEKIGRRVITLYGGSINPENAAPFFAMEHIDGGLVGQASLDAEKFLEIIKNA